MLEEARLFVIDEADRKSAADLTGIKLNDWHPDEQLAENFHLPFPCIAIEAENTCVVMRTTNQQKRHYEVVGRRDASGKRNETLFQSNITALPGMFLLDGQRLGSIVSCRDLRVFEGGRELDFSMSELALSESKRVKFKSEFGDMAEWIEEDEPGETGFRINGEALDFHNPVAVKEKVAIDVGW